MPKLINDALLSVLRRGAAENGSRLLETGSGALKTSSSSSMTLDMLLVRLCVLLKPSPEFLLLESCDELEDDPRWEPSPFEPDEVGAMPLRETASENDGNDAPLKGRAEVVRARLIWLAETPELERIFPFFRRRSSSLSGELGRSIRLFPLRPGDANTPGGCRGRGSSGLGSRRRGFVACESRRVTQNRTAEGNVRPCP